MQEEERLIESGSEWAKHLMDSPSMDESADLGYFRVWLVIAQLFGVACIVLVSAWCGQHLGGFAWQEDPARQFNYHPFFMVLGFIFCYGNALLVYRGLRNQRKNRLKLLHLGLHTAAFIFAVVALKAVFDSHNLLAQPIPNLYSLHSWIGITAIILFAMQYLLGFVAFLVPGLTKVWRAKYLPLHVFFGLAIFILAIAAALSGITEKLIFSTTYKELPPSAIVGNLLGYCLLIHGIVVVYLVATPHFRRRMLPEEIQLQMEQHIPTN